jgi:hypothetical protein
MAQSLSDFIQSLYQAAINSASSVYLPTVLLEQTLPADPLAVGSASLGDLAAIDPALPSNLCAALTQGTIASPASAQMQLSRLQLSGIAYALPDQPTVTGQQVSAVFNFNVAPAIPGLPKPQLPQLAGNFSIALSCCPSSDGNSCSGASQPQTISGTMSTTFAGASATVTLTVSPDFPSAGFTVTIDSIAFAAQSLATTIQVTSPDQSGQLGAALNAAFRSVAANTAILQQFNAGLAQPSVLTSLSSVFTAAFQNLQNPSVLSFVISMLYRAAINPASSAYLPTVISEASNPALEPYSVQGPWSFGDVSSFDPQAGETICGGISTLQTSDIATPGSPVLLTLLDVQLAGLSNALPQPLLAINDEVAGMVVFGQVAGWPHQLVISGHFSLQVSCCPTQDFQTCSGPSQNYTGTGTFSAAIGAASAAIDITVSADNNNNLFATVNKIYFRTDPDIINPDNIQFTIAITSIPAGQQADWNQMAETLFNAPQAAGAIVANIQQQMNLPSVLAKLSALITQALQNTGAGERAATVAYLRQLTKRTR